MSLLAMVTLTLAADPAPPPSDGTAPGAPAEAPGLPAWREPPAPWSGPAQPGMAAARAGVILGAAGEVAFLTGVTFAYIGSLGWEGPSDPTLATTGLVLAGAGAIATRLGPALMAGGAGKGRKALLERGQRVPFTAGWLAWGFWGGTLATTAAWGVFFSQTSLNSGVVLVLAAVDSAMVLGAYTSGGVQMGLQTGAWRGGPVALRTTPFLLEDGAGLAMTFTF